MAKWTDEQGDTWVVEFDFFAIDAVRSEMDLDLNEMLKSEKGAQSLFTEISSDLVTLTKVLWCICKEQAEEKGVDFRTFAKRMIGQSYMDAQLAWMEAVAFFFQRPVREKILGELNKVRAERADLMNALNS